MEVLVSDTFKVKIDNFGNHIPIWYSEGGEIVPLGKNKGLPAEPKWIKEEKYFHNLPKALYWGVENGKLGVEIKSEYTLDEYLDHLYAIYNQTYDFVMQSEGSVEKI